jgi:hypothetical protein
VDARQDISEERYGFGRNKMFPLDRDLFGARGDCLFNSTNGFHF